jgi:hypothetical protein
MYKADVKEHFGSLDAIASVLNISKSAVSQWPDLIPRGAAYELQVITGGKLTVNAALYAKRARKVSAAAHLADPNWQSKGWRG